MIRSAAFLTAVLLVLGGIYAGAVLFYWDPETRGREEAAQMQAKLADYDRRLAQTRAEMSELSAPGDDATLVLGDESQSAPWLQGAIRQAVAAVGGVATVTQTSVAPISEQHSKLSLLLRARFEEDGLLSFLKQVETSLPPMIVESMAVQPTNVDRSQPSLDVTATIFVIISNAVAS